MIIKCHQCIYASQTKQFCYAFLTEGQMKALRHMESYFTDKEMDSICIALRTSNGFIYAASSSKNNECRSYVSTS